MEQSLRQRHCEHRMFRLQAEMVEEASLLSLPLPTQNIINF